MARLGALRPPPCALPLLLLAAALGVCAFYGLRAPPRPRPRPAPTPDRAPAPDPARARLHLLLMFTKAARSPALQARAQAALRSLLRRARLQPGQVLHLHFVSEPRSRQIARGLLRPLLRGLPFRCQAVFHDVDVLTEQLGPVVEAMRKHFSAGSGAYYSDSIFFLSVAMHRIMPTGTRSGSSAVRTPRPRWVNPLLTDCLALTAGSCCWTWKPCASPNSTTSCWSQTWCGSSRRSTTSRATWGTRTSSP
ncbi:unnamed protein product [Natator depressus]